MFAAAVAVVLMLPWLWPIFWNSTKYIDQHNSTLRQWAYPSVGKNGTRNKST